MMRIYNNDRLCRAIKDVLDEYRSGDINIGDKVQSLAVEFLKLYDPNNLDSPMPINKYMEYEICAEYYFSDKTQEALAEKYGMDQSYISRIIDIVISEMSLFIAHSILINGN